MKCVSFAHGSTMYFYITSTKLDYFVYKTKKLWLKYYNVQKKS